MTTPGSPSSSRDKRKPVLLQVATASVTIRGFLVPYAMHFRSMGWRVEAAAAGATLSPELTSTFDSVHDVSFSRSIRDVRSLLRGHREVAKLISTSAPDIVHVHTPIASFITRFAVRRIPADARPSIVYTAHGFHFHAAGSPIPNLLFRTAERIAGRWTDRLVVINAEDESAAKRYRLVPFDRLVRMRGIGLDTTFYSPQADSPTESVDLMTRLGMPAGARYFALVAEFHPNKRHSDVLRALAMAQHADVYLVFAGEGPLRPSLETLADRLGLRERVRFAGYVADVRPLLRLAAAGILASRREGLPRSIMESLSVGTPVIGTAARGVDELLNPDSGIVVPIGDVAALSRAMDWILDHPTDGRAMGLRGRQRMRDAYDLGVVIGEHERLYAGLLAERRERSSAPT